MHQLGWSYQKPERRALERDDEAIDRWKRQTWPRVKKTLRGWVLRRDNQDGSRATIRMRKTSPWGHDGGRAQPDRSHAPKGGAIRRDRAAG
jgi:hypothetical protein